MKNVVQISVNLYENQIEMLNEISKILKKSRTEIIREALDILINDFTKKERIQLNEMDKD